MPRVGRNREKNRRMPTGWMPTASGIYFRPMNARDREIVRALTGGPLCLRLGADRDEAARTFAEKIVAARTKAERVELAEPGTVAELCARAREEYLPTIENPKTREWRERHVGELEREFGARRYAINVYDATKAAPGTYLVAMDLQRYIDANRKTRHVAVNRAAQTWKIVFDEARRRWGLTEYNPAAGLSKNRERAREVLPDDRAHFFRAYREASPPMRFMLALGRYYGRRPGEALAIDVSGIDDAGVHTVKLKRRRELILAWDDVKVGERPDGTPITRPGRLRRMIARALRWRESVIRPTRVWKNGRRPKAPAVIDTALLVNRRGRRMTKSGYTSEFRRLMERLGLVEELGEVTLADGSKRRRTRRAFVPYDTRAKRASTLSLAQATEVLDHDDQRTTSAHYRRGARVISVPAERRKKA